MNKRVFNDKSLEHLFDDGNAFKIAKNLEGKIYRDYANRKTKQFFFRGSSYFIKYHGPVGWREILKNFIQLKIPVIGAEREWKALLKLRSVGLDCSEPLAFMSRGWNPANSESFLITKDLQKTISLEDFFLKGAFKKRSTLEKRSLITKLAIICRTMHLNGLNHRDLYLCHFHINASDKLGERIFLIDLHRGQIRKRVPLRWATKDIGGLLHSIIPFGISETDCYRFLMVYFDCSFEHLIKEKTTFINQSRSRAFDMHMKPILKEIDITNSNKLEENSLYLKKKGMDYRWIGLKSALNDPILNALEDLDKIMQTGRVIKKEAGHFIVSLELGGKEFFIKKYQIKGKSHLLRKYFSQSRANISWKAIHWLRAVNINTVNPVVIYERFNSLFALEAFLITEKIEGTILSDALKENEKDYLIAARIQSLFKRLKWIGFNHGDAKTSNFYFNQDKLIVFDLDASRKSISSMMKTNMINKDIKRILRSTIKNKRLNLLLSRRLKD